MTRGLTLTAGPLNDTVWDRGYVVDVVFLVANCSVLLITSVVGVVANLFVVWAVCHQTSLQTWNNALLVNLAIVDALRCAVDCPLLFAIVTAAHRRERAAAVAGGLICDAQVVTFSFGCCVQLLTLACIGAERYQAIAHPFKSAQARRSRVTVLIPLIWTLAIVVAVLCLTFVKDSPVYVKCNGTRLGTMHSYDTFGLYILGPLWTACFVLITGFYARIFAIVRAHGRKIFDKGSVPVSRKEKTKDTTDEQKENGDKGEAEKGQRESEKNQSQRQPVAQVEQLITAEPNLDSLIVIPGSTKPPESKIELKATVKLLESVQDKCPPKVQRAETNETKVTKGRFRNSAGDTDDTEAQVKVEPLFPGVERAIPRVKRAEPSTSRKDMVVSLQLDDVTAKPTGVLTDAAGSKITGAHPESSREENNKPVEVVLRTQLVKETQLSSFKTSELKVREKTQFDLRRPLALQTEPKPSNQVTVADLTSLVITEVQTKSIFKKESGDKERVDKELYESQEPRPEISSAPRANGTQCSSTEQVKDNDRREVSVVKDEQVSAFGQQAQANHASEVSGTGAGTGAATGAGTAEADGAVCMMPSLGNKERVVKNKESKTAKRSGYIIFTFLLFWLPLITTILLNSLGHRQNRRSEVEVLLNVEVLSVSVACMTSLSDPIIYAVVNPQFRTEFYRLRNKWKAFYKT